LFVAELTSLESRRDQLLTSFFHDIYNSSGQSLRKSTKNCSLKATFHYTIQLRPGRRPVASLSGLSRTI